MKVGYLITGRLKSTRLPNKLLLQIEGKTIIGHLIERLQLAENVDEIVICTSTNKQDKPLGDIAKKYNIKCFFGDPDDVLLRLFRASEKYKLDYILNITADCPFADPFYADKIVDKFRETNADFIRQFDLPHGVFSYGIKVDALRKVIEIKDSNETEVWGRYFTDTGLFNVLDLDVDNVDHKRPGLRMTLDYPEDFDYFKAIFKNLYREGEIFTLTEILMLLGEKKEIIKINKHCSAKFSSRFTSQSEPIFKKNYQVSKALIIGSGSIGQRHIRNLKKIGIDNIIALRSKKGHFQDLSGDLNIDEVECWDEVVKANPDVAIVTNPTSLHLDTACKIIPYVKGIMIEKPLSHSLDGCSQLISLLNKNRTVSFVGLNLMFHPIIRVVKEYILNNDVGEIINFQCQVGEWLPDWHPYEDYKRAYYARKELGGGVALTLIHEIHLALTLLGLPSQVFGMITDYDKLDVDVDMCSDFMIKHNSGSVSQIHLDCLQKVSHRCGLITFEKAWIRYDFNELTVVAQSKGDEQSQIIWHDAGYDYNQMYIKQLKAFISYVEEGRMKHDHDTSLSIECIKVVESFFNSIESGRSVNIKRNERFSF